jgi:hypothetical protein
MQVIASFDLGIKNLSYCVASFDASGSLVTVDRWANLNLLAGGSDSQTQTRCSCGGPASWSLTYTGSQTIWCKKCVKRGLHGAFQPIDISGTKLADWRTWAITGLGLSEVEAKRKSKAALEEAARQKYLMPYKAPKAKGVTLQTLLAAMEVTLDSELVHLAAAQRIRLENQPSEFAPHMKSVQIMLFVLIDHRLRTEHGWSGTIEFVNAGVKTRGCAGAGTGKDAKRSRKLAGIARVKELLAKDTLAEKLSWWLGQAKQDDLADALLMCVDAAN